MIRTNTYRLIILALPTMLTLGYMQAAARVYYIDAVSGNDQHDGLTASSAWQSIDKIQRVALHAGDTVKFARGSAYDKPFYVNDSGNEENPIVITAYGTETLPAPAFTNKTFEQDNFGNCIRIRGNYVVVENLYFHETTAYVGGNYTTDGGWAIWEMGAVYIDKGTQHCIIRNNEFFDCPVGIKSYGKHVLITYNYLHDCNRVLAEWSWGPLGIWFGADYQEASYNRIFNYSAVNPNIQWVGGGGGADGGAFEVDDGRYPKFNIHVHHNYTKDCQGFMEVTWTDVVQNPDYENFRIHHNVSDDYQTFTAIWRGKNFEIDNNTIIRRKKNVVDWGVFNITGTNTKNKIRNNIIVTEQNIRIFNTGINSRSTPNNIIENNLYYAASGGLNLGVEGPGTSLVQGNPLFVNYAGGVSATDFALTAGSPAINKAQILDYTRDFIGTPIPQGILPDIGAFEFPVSSMVTETKPERTFIYKQDDKIVINNHIQSKQAIIYNLMGKFIKRVHLHEGENTISITRNQAYIIALENKIKKIIL